jgi:preprotein translocase subunit YajC
MAVILLYLALLAVAFFFLIVRPQRRQMAARRALIQQLDVGDEIITAGGIYGTILEMSDTTILVQVAPGVELKLAREAVSGRPAPPPEPADDDVDLRSDGDPADSRQGDSAVADPPKAEDD